MNRKNLMVCMAALLVLACVITVSAEEFDPGKTGSISVTLTERQEKTPIAGAELSLYYLATVGVNTEGELNYIYTDGFAGIGISLDDPNLVAELDAYLAANELPATKLRTDEEGTAVWKNLPLGLYLVRQTSAVEGFAPCTPFLVTLPAADEGGYVYEVNASPKTEVAKLTSLTIRKVWNTDASAKATDSVTVQLLRDNQVVQTVVLNEQNHWQVTLVDMPESDAYSVQEVDVPEGFTATYHQAGYVFTVTNTATLIQTGQLIWPIPLLAFAGIILLSVGSVLLGKKREQNA